MALMCGDVVLRMYIDHTYGALWEVVPLMNRLVPPANDAAFDPNV